MAYTQSHPQSLDDYEVRQLTVVDPNVRLRPLSDDTDQQAVEFGKEDVISWATPDDQLEDALDELEQWTAEELLDMIGRASPKFFEMLVLDLLHAMGYGANRDDLQHVGGPGDGGIDGIISLDRLGLEKVAVQAKRWQGSVRREVVNAFYGALAGQHVKKGILITTSSFTAQAVEFARSVEGIVLVDGTRLTRFMMEHGVGVSHRPIKVPSINRDYFEDFEE